MNIFSQFWVTYGSVVQFVMINMLLGISIYFTLYTGLLSLANAGFMAIGAYVSAVLSIHTGLPFPAALLIGASSAAFIGWLLGLPVLRLKDVYLAIATLGFGEIVRIIAVSFDKFTGLDLLGGAQGLSGIPKLTTPLSLLFVLILLSVFMIQFHRSRAGRALAAIRRDESVAATMGIDVANYKLLAFVLGAFVAGLGWWLQRTSDSFRGSERFQLHSRGQHFGICSPWRNIALDRRVGRRGDPHHLARGVALHGRISRHGQRRDSRVGHFVHATRTRQPELVPSHLPQEGGASCSSLAM